MYCVPNPSRLSVSLVELVEPGPIGTDQPNLPQAESNLGDTIILERLFRNADLEDTIDRNESNGSADNASASRDYAPPLIDLTELMERRVSRGRGMDILRGSSRRSTSLRVPRHNRLRSMFHFRNPFRSQRHRREDSSLSRSSSTPSTPFPTPTAGDSSLTLGRNGTIISDAPTVQDGATYEQSVRVLSSSSTSRTPALAHPFLFNRRDVSIRRDDEHRLSFHLRSLFNHGHGSIVVPDGDVPDTREVGNYDGQDSYPEIVMESDELTGSEATYSDIAPSDLIAVPVVRHSSETDATFVRPPAPVPIETGVAFSLRRLVFRSSSRRERYTGSARSPPLSSQDLFIARSGESSNLQNLPLEFQMSATIVNPPCVSKTATPGDLTPSTPASSRSNDPVRTQRREFVNSLGRNRDLFHMLGRFETRFSDPLEHSGHTVCSSAYYSPRTTSSQSNTSFCSGNLKDQFI